MFCSQKVVYIFSAFSGCNAGFQMPVELGIMGQERGKTGAVKSRETS